MRRFDHAVSIGYRCSSQIAIDFALGGRQLLSPFSYVNCMSFGNVRRIIENRFSGFPFDLRRKGGSRAGDGGGMLDTTEVNSRHYARTEETEASFRRKISRFRDILADEAASTLFVAVNEDWCYIAEYRDKHEQHVRSLMGLVDALARETRGRMTVVYISNNEADLALEKENFVPLFVPWAAPTPRDTARFRRGCGEALKRWLQQS